MANSNVFSLHTRETLVSHEPNSALAPTPQTAGRILLVDDIADNRAVLGRRFVRRDFEIVEAASGPEALALIEQQEFDLVLLDIMMPGMDGIETLRRIRAKHSNLALPVIMVSAKTQSEDVVQALELGANDYVTKPVDFSVALARATAQVSRKRAALEAQNARLALEQVNNELEQKVDERTAGLTQANERLKAEIAQRRLSEEKIQYLAHHDVLTGLPNRRLFQEELAEAYREAQETRCTVTLILVDLDGFKAVNDTLGHSVGDALLRAVADRLRNIFATKGKLSRLGGDEFAIIDLGANQQEHAAAMARQVIEAFAQPFDVLDHQIALSTSVGIALSEHGSIPSAQLVQQADLALYRTKEVRRGSFSFYEPEMDARSQERRTIEMGLRMALQRSELDVCYQPIVSADGNRVLCFEALLRWHPSGLAPVSPAKFIPIAEETGLIVPIGEWVLRQACLEATRWPDGIRVAVNVSIVQFNSGNLVASVLSALASCGLPAERLEIEITESVMLDQGQGHLETLNQLKSLGVKISMDDFGTGYSSLSYLRDFNFDKIKIDQGFIRDMSDEQGSRAIVRAVAGLGRSFGMCTTAEGVETAQQFDYLQQEGIDQLQGYYFSKPLESRLIPQFLSKMPRPGDKEGT